MTEESSARSLRDKILDNLADYVCKYQDELREYNMPAARESYLLAQFQNNSYDLVAKTTRTNQDTDSVEDNMVRSVLMEELAGNVVSYIDRLEKRNMPPARLAYLVSQFQAQLFENLMFASIRPTDGSNHVTGDNEGAKDSDSGVQKGQDV